MAPARKRKLPDISEIACRFCFREQNFSPTFKEWVQFSKYGAHNLCLLFSSNLQGTDENSSPNDLIVNNFRLSDVKKEIVRGGSLSCSVCKYKGASIGCSQPKCRKCFHLPCALDANACCIYGDTFPVYCFDHAPKQNLSRWSKNLQNPIQCCVCLEFFSDELCSFLRNMSPLVNLSARNRALPKCLPPALEVDEIENNTKENDSAIESKIPTCSALNLDPKNSSITFCEIIKMNLYEIIHGECCPSSWMHRKCCSQYALTAGLHHLRCPICSNVEKFQNSLKHRGIWIIDKDADWEEEPGAFQDLYESVQASCYAKECECPQGHEFDDAGWSLCLCEICSCVFVHDNCSQRAYNKELSKMSLEQNAFIYLKEVSIKTEKPITEVFTREFRDLVNRNMKNRDNSGVRTEKASLEDVPMCFACLNNSLKEFEKKFK